MLKYGRTFEAIVPFSRDKKVEVTADLRTRSAPARMGQYKFVFFILEINKIRLVPVTAVSLPDHSSLRGLGGRQLDSAQSQFLRN